MKKFLSTPSVGRATFKAEMAALIKSNFYPRPPWGGRLAFSCHVITST